MTIKNPQAGSVAIVTGASSGIGEALAHKLAEYGHSLILIARRESLLEALATQLSQTHGVNVDIRVVDLSDRTARHQLCDELAGLPVSVLCNNAGYVNWGLVQDLDPAAERMVVELNTVAVHDLTLAVLPGMLARGTGYIEMTGSIAGVQPMPGAATYSATKAFVNNFCEGLYEELRGTGVICTLLAPGPVATGITDASGIAGVNGAGGGLVWMSAERVAADTLKAMEKGKRVLVPGLFAKLNVLSGRHAPHSLLLPVVKEIMQRVKEVGRKE